MVRAFAFNFLQYMTTKGIVITPTISLMQDQVQKLNGIGILSVYLGFAQFDKNMEKPRQ